WPNSSRPTPACHRDGGAVKRVIGPIGKDGSPERRHADFMLRGGSYSCPCNQYGEAPRPCPTPTSGASLDHAERPFQGPWRQWLAAAATTGATAEASWVGARWGARR